MGFLEFLTLVLIVLKLTAVIHITWLTIALIYILPNVVLLVIFVLFGSLIMKWFVSRNTLGLRRHRR